MTDVRIIGGPVDGAIERITSLHSDYYGQNWGFGPYFENKVNAGLSEFLGRYDPQRDGLWTAWVEDQIEGAIALDGLNAESESAHLRWFIVSDQVRGSGVGARLIRSAVEFADAHGYPSVFLWTFRGLDAAKHLYEREGFVLTEKHPGTQWGTEVVEQRFERGRCSSAHSLQDR